MGNPRPNTMAKGEAMTPVPEGIITTTETWQEGSDSPTLLVNAGLVSDVSKLIMSLIF